MVIAGIQRIARGGKSAAQGQSNDKTNSKSEEHASTELSRQEKIANAIQDLDKYDRFDSGNTKIDHVGEIGDLMDEGDDEKVENLRAR